MMVIMNERYFRAGAGTVIYNQEGHVAWFQRTHYPEVWQFQQGGIDADEAPEAAMWRELHEETGLTQADTARATEYPRWTIYEYTTDIITNTGFPDRLGQVHRWWFLGLKPEVTIDLTKASDKEFSDWRWTTFDAAIAETNDLKRHVYEELHEFFKTIRS